MSNSAFRSAYNLAFQVSPIILTGGAFSFPVPIIALIGQLGAFVQGLATSGKISESDFYATFLPVPGSTVINNSVATYPFANQRTAANAIVENPKTISLQMIAPVRDNGGYLTKTAIFTALQTALQNHNNNGGTYSIATPAYIYNNCIMTAMTDTTQSQTQRQITWQLDFLQPLISAQDATSAMSALMGKISGGAVLNSSMPSGLTGSTPLSGIPAAVNNMLALPTS